jgi:hypothetical protein
VNFRKTNPIKLLYIFVLLHLAMVENNLQLVDGQNNRRILLKCKEMRIVAGQDTNRITLDATSGNVRIGGNERHGALRLYSGQVDTFSYGYATLTANSSTGSLEVGTAEKVGKRPNQKGIAGKIVIRNSSGNDSVLLNGNPGGGDSISVREVTGTDNLNIFACSYSDEMAGLHIGSAKSDKGTRKKAGYVAIRDKKGDDKIVLNGNPGKGENNISVHKGRMAMLNKKGSDSVIFDGEKGDIILRNGDCAEEFDISPSEMSEVEPGNVMVIDNAGSLQVSSKPCDTRVAGVISGGGNLRPDIVLDKKESQNLRAPLAMLGKVFCKVDADESSIKLGDMLTTSSTRGHAMKAINRSKAFGAVIGKALGTLKTGTGLIPILVTLQ